MPFQNEIAGGQGTITRPQLKSENYVQNVSGWAIFRNGDVEFNNGTFRGEVLIQDPDGSYVKIFDEDPGSGAIVEIRPADTPAGTLTPGRLYTALNGSNRPFIVLQGPQLDSMGFCDIQLYGDELGNRIVTISGDELQVQTSSFTVTNDLDVGGTIVADAAFVGATSFLARALCDAVSYVYFNGPAVADTKNNNTFADIKDNTGAAMSIPYKKFYGSADTDLEVTVYFTMTQQGAASNNFSIRARDSGGTTQLLINSGLVNTALNVHTFYASTGRFTGLSATQAGTLSIQWARTAGAGTLVRDANAYIAVSVREVPVP